MPLLLALLFAVTIRIAGGYTGYCADFENKDQYLLAGQATDAGDASQVCEYLPGPGCMSVVSRDFWVLNGGATPDCNSYCALQSGWTCAAAAEHVDKGCQSSVRQVLECDQPGVQAQRRLTVGSTIEDLHKVVCVCASSNAQMDALLNFYGYWGITATFTTASTTTSFTSTFTTTNTFTATFTTTFPSTFTTTNTFTTTLTTTLTLTSTLTTSVTTFTTYVATAATVAVDNNNDIPWAIIVIVACCVCACIGGISAYICYVTRRKANQQRQAQSQQPQPQVVPQVSADNDNSSMDNNCVAIDVGALPMADTFSFWFMPVSEFLKLPEDQPLPAHQELRDKGLLVKRSISMGDVVNGLVARNTAAISHRWMTPEHPDPDGSKTKKLKEIFRELSFIEYVWMDFISAPQKGADWHRTPEEDAEFHAILENILPYIYLGATVVILYERIYGQRFWPCVETWVSTKAPTTKGLEPATSSKMRARFYGMLSMTGQDAQVQEFMLTTWGKMFAQEAIDILGKDDILVTNKKDKDVNLKVVGELDGIVRKHFDGLDEECKAA